MFAVFTESAPATTTTLPTGAFVATIVTEAVLPSLVAVMVVEPAATPETRPAASTVAIAVLFECQATARPFSTPPAESFVIAVSCAV